MIRFAAPPISPPPPPYFLADSRSYPRKATLHWSRIHEQMNIQFPWGFCAYKLMRSQTWGFCIQNVYNSNQFESTFAQGGWGWGGGVKSICRDDCDYQGGKLLRLLSYPNYVQEFGLSIRNTVGLVPGYSSICISSRKFCCDNMFVTTYYTVQYCSA